jgi:hypothetical protein
MDARYDQRSSKLQNSSSKTEFGIPKNGAAKLVFKGGGLA